MADMIRAVEANNASFAAAKRPSIKFADFPNTPAALIVTCMDPRCNPTNFWQYGEEGPGVLRNAGGRATEDVLRSMRVLSTIMGNGKNTLGAVALIHHTDCGLMNFDNEFIAGTLKQRCPEHGAEIEQMDFGGFTDPEQSLKHDAQLIRNDPYLPKDLEVLAYVYDTFSGKTREIQV